MSKQLFVGLCIAAALFVSTTSSAWSQSSVKEIDTECNAIQNAVMALQPIHVGLVSSKWVVLSDADYTAAQQQNASALFADVYKQGANFAWVHSHSADSKGNQRATQLCFRQSDGSLERARQATTIADLSGASAQQAYFASDGTVIQKTSLFEINDPAIAKTIKSLPFYAVLPQ